jgi:acylphosphatase
VYVSGRVQGVFFRTRTRYEAEKNGVVGWVRNLPDDRVEAVFEGERENVERLVEFCRRGPSGSLVTTLDLFWEDYSGKFERFEIVY